MRLLTCLTLAAAAALAAAVAAPAYGQSMDTDTMAGSSSVTVQGAQPFYKLDAKEFKEYRGTYLLSNGQRLTLSAANQRYYAAIEGQPAFEIVPVRPNTFVGRGNGVRMRFDVFQQGRTHDVVLSAPRSALLGDGVRLGSR